ncbi:Transient receptor putative cation channel sub M member 2 [Branchiostoma belcheri]|nr:Transient receptor putative cation channel sub M member 2 [Branchiostoma belcheri]
MPPDTHWESLKHTSIGKTNAFGELEFVGFGQRVGKFMRVNHTTEPEDVLKVMREQWNLELPNLLISVTGGAKNFYIKPRLQEVFRKGLIKAAQSTVNFHVEQAAGNITLTLSSHTVAAVWTEDGSAFANVIIQTLRPGLFQLSDLLSLPTTTYFSPRNTLYTS